MADFGEVLLDILSKRECLESLQLSEELSLEHQKIVGAIKSLQSIGDIVECEQNTSTRWLLTEEGEEIANDGSHEAILYNNIPKDGIAQNELFAILGPAKSKVGFSKAMSLNWISIDKKAEGGPMIYKKVDKIEDVVQRVCKNVKDNKLEKITDQQKSDCKKRKLISESKVVTYILRKGVNFKTTIEKQETELTQEMLASGSWKTMQFKAYNFNAKGLDPQGGHLHPLLKVRTQFRQIFLEMGFTEMPTNNFVESSFWNFDALFQPQQHPARDAHDTFFLSDPAEARTFPMDYLERVKEVHSVGGYGSLGHKCDWKEKEAAKNIMRTHTTGVSARMLYKLAIQPTFVPSKFFSIDRVFRNETLDATHLAEFHQIEGLVADYGLTLGDLMGYIQEFFKKYGIKKLKFKPAFNPYTEPSMEIFSYHEGLKKWVEVGNSGVFRPEMLLPMGLPKDVSVIAWGLSLERPTMIKYGIQNIRDIFGPRVDLQKVYDNPICRLGDTDNSIQLTMDFPESENKTTRDESSSEMLMLEKRLDKVIDRIRKLRSRADGCAAFQLKLTKESATSVKKSEPQWPTPSLSKCSVSSTSFVPAQEEDYLPRCKSGGTLRMGMPNFATNVLPTCSCNAGFCNNSVISCDPFKLPVSLIILLDILKATRAVRVSSFVHSSLRLSSPQSEKLKSIFNADNDNCSNQPLKMVAIIWKSLGGFADCMMSIGLNRNILGEANIAGHLFHLAEERISGNVTGLLAFSGGVRNPDDVELLTLADDLVECCKRGRVEEIVASLSSILLFSEGPMLFGAHVSLADVFAWSRLVQSKGQKKLPAAVLRWHDHCSKLPYFLVAHKLL